jgi:hypothetical protein
MLSQLTVRQISFCGALLCVSFVLLSQSVNAKGDQSRVQARVKASQPRSATPQLPVSLATEPHEPHELAPKAPSNLIKVPMLRQSTDFTCGVSALQSVFAYFGDDYREDQLAKELKAVPKTGTHYQEMMRLAKAKGYSVKVVKSMTIPELKKLIDNGKPVICLI